MHKSNKFFKINNKWIHTIRPSDKRATGRKNTNKNFTEIGKEIDDVRTFLVQCTPTYHINYRR